jgi:hypothetical protein
MSSGLRLVTIPSSTTRNGLLRIRFPRRQDAGQNVKRIAITTEDGGERKAAAGEGKAERAA